MVELVVVTLTRLILHTTARMIYPFLPAIGRGLGVSPTRARLLISARSALGFTSPVFGPISDRFGRRSVMLLGLGVLTLSLILVPLSPVFGVALLAFALIGLSSFIYDPAVQAYIGDRVPYNKRGLAIGITELSWSAGLLIGAPVIGFSIQRFGWSSPFLALAALSALSFLGMLVFIQRDTGTSSQSGRIFAQSWRLLAKQPAALGALGCTLLVSVGSESLLVVYGEWMEGSFGLQVVALGLSTAVIGVADLVGELVVVAASDRVGKRRLMLAGMAVSTLAYVGLPRLGKFGLPVALVVLFVMFVTWEAAAVARLSLISELLPAARGTMLASNIAVVAVGRMSGALLGSWLWNTGGFAFNGTAAGVLNLLAVVLVLAVVPEAAMQASEAPDAAT